MKYILLASSNTRAGISQLINKFWCSTDYTVDPATLAILNPNKSVSDKVRVVHVKGRYRFERLA